MVYDRYEPVIKQDVQINNLSTTNTINISPALRESINKVINRGGLPVDIVVDNSSINNNNELQEK
jgi:antitoxin component of RelBE/YafQ-DinJ toxin-antitoxin module